MDVRWRLRWRFPGIAVLAVGARVGGPRPRAVGAVPWRCGRAAPPLADPLKLPPSLRAMNADQAYDGEFFYRLAVDPFVSRDVGIRLDGPGYRQQRVLYPLLVTALSLGRDRWVPCLLISWNEVGLW